MHWQGCSPAHEGACLVAPLLHFAVFQTRFPSVPSLVNVMGWLTFCVHLATPWWSVVQEMLVRVLGEGV